MTGCLITFRQSIKRKAIVDQKKGAHMFGAKIKFVDIAVAIILGLCVGTVGLGLLGVRFQLTVYVSPPASKLF